MWAGGIIAKDPVMLTVAQFAAMFPQANRANLLQFAEPLDAAMEVFDITTVTRQAMFLAQCAHESALFRHVTENLSYSSADRLRQVFSAFRHMDPLPFVNQPKKLANLVYANKLGNGDVRSGDGWRYRGRGLLQVTGKSNYAALVEALEHDIIADSDYLATPEGAARSAACWWQQHGCNRLADHEDIAGCTRVINGARLLGLAERTQLWHQARHVLTSGAERQDGTV
jgi:putative chitinase